MTPTLFTADDFYGIVAKRDDCAEIIPQVAAVAQAKFSEWYQDNHKVLQRLLDDLHRAFYEMTVERDALKAENQNLFRKWNMACIQIKELRVLLGRAREVVDLEMNDLKELDYKFEAEMCRKLIAEIDAVLGGGHA